MASWNVFPPSAFTCQESWQATKSVYCTPSATICSSVRSLGLISVISMIRANVRAASLGMKYGDCHFDKSLWRYFSHFSARSVSSSLNSIRSPSLNSIAYINSPLGCLTALLYGSGMQRVSPMQWGAAIHPVSASPDNAHVKILPCTVCNVAFTGGWGLIRRMVVVFFPALNASSIYELNNSDFILSDSLFPLLYVKTNLSTLWRTVFG